MNTGKANQETVDWLVLDLNSFFASCEQQENPQLRGKPIMVLPTMAETTCVIAASFEAKQFGVKTGTIVADARRMCPGIIAIQAQHRRYVEYHHKVLDAVEECLPIEDVMSIDEVACRLTGTQRDVAKAMELARVIKKNVQHRAGECLTSSVGLATNKLLAKLASDMQKPDGLTVLARADLPGKIGHLPVRAVPGIGHRMQIRLAQHGIATVGELLAADQHQFRAIWGGVTGLRMHTLLHGDDLPDIETHTSSISHQHVLEPMLRTMPGAHEFLRLLLMKAATRLRTKGYFCRSMGVQVKPMGGQPSYWMERTLPETQSSLIMLRALEEMWPQFPACKPLRVGVVLMGLVEAGVHQLDFFEARRDNSLDTAVDAINHRYGRNTVTFGSVKRVSNKTHTKIAFHRVPELWEMSEKE